MTITISDTNTNYLKDTRFGGLQVYVPGHWAGRAASPGRYERISGQWLWYPTVFPDNMKKLTCPDLRMRCSAFGLKTAGIKSILVERLKKHQFVADVRPWKGRNKPTKMATKTKTKAQPVRTSNPINIQLNELGGHGSGPNMETWKTVNLPSSVKYNDDKMFLRMRIPADVKFVSVYCQRKMTRSETPRAEQAIMLQFQRGEGDSTAAASSGGPGH